MATNHVSRAAGAERLINVERELARLEGMPPRELREEYAEVFGVTTNAKNKRWLVKRIIWRLQANAEGDLSERARRRAAELADDADLRTTAPREMAMPTPDRTDEHREKFEPDVDQRLPRPGAELVRRYKGHMVRVLVLADGFEWQGTFYGSLSAVAKAITGSHWNGFRFFGLNRRSAK